MHHFAPVLFTASQPCTASPLHSDAQSETQTPIAKMRGGAVRSGTALWCRLLLAAFLGALSISAASAQVVYNGQRSTVVSGTQTFYSTGPTLLEPSGLVVDHNGILWVNDEGTGAIYKYVPSGGGFTLSSEYPAYTTVAAVNNECADLTFEIAVDAQNHLYYPASSDGGNPGQCVNGAQEDGGWFSGTDPLSAYAVALDSAGNAYLSDAVSGVIWEYPVPVGQITQNGPEECTPEGECANSFAVNDFAAISINNYPNGLAVDRFGNIFYTTGSELFEGVNQGNNNYNIQTIASGFSFPYAIAVNSQGVIYVADDYNNRIVREIPTPTGYVQTAFGGFNHPLGVTVDDSGNVYVSDTDNFQLIKYGLSAPNLGSQNVGSSSGAQGLSFTILPNTTIGSVAIVTKGATGKDFTDAGGSTCTAKTYTSSTNCTVNVQFTPSAAGVRSGAIVFYDGSGNPIQTLELTGTGEGPEPVFESSISTTLTPSADYYYDWGATALDGAGNVYISVPSSDEILVTPPGGSASLLSLSSPTTDPNETTASAALNNPSAVAVDNAGTLYIADTGNNRILVRQPTATTGAYYLYNLPTTGLTLNAPQGVATDTSGDIFIADTGNNRIVEVTASGVAKVFGPSIPTPVSVATDGSGNVYLTDTLNGDAFEISSNGKTLTQLSVPLDEPLGIAVDAAGTIYIADEKLGIIELKSNGTSRNMNLTWPLNDFGPNGITLDPAGNVYLSYGGLGVYELPRASATLNFATTKTGSTSTDSPQTVILQNVGNQTLTLSSLTYPTDFPEEGGDSAACTGTSSLAGGAQCDLPITFQPTTGTTLSEQVTLVDNAGNVSGATQAVSVNGTGVVGGESQTISSPLSGGTFTKTPSYAYSTAGPLVYIQASSGLPVTVTVLSGPGNFGGAASSSTNHVLSSTGAGVVTVMATQAGNATYAPAPPVTFTVTFTAAPISVNTRHSTFTQVYGAAAPTVTFLLSGLVNVNDQVYLTITGGATPASPVGNDTITFGLTGPMASSYYLESGSTTGTLVVSPAPLTVVPYDAYMLAGGTVPTFNYTLLGLVAGDTAATAVTGAPTLSSTATSSSAAGSYPIDLSLGTLASTNYTLTAANGVLNVFSPINMGSVAVGSTGTQTVTFQTGPASTFSNVLGGTEGNGTGAFHADAFSCSAGTCTGTVDFAPSQPGTWNGAYSLLGQGSPSTLLLSIPVTGTGTGPELVFNPAQQTTFASSLSQPFGVAIDSSGNTYISEDVYDINSVLEYPYGGGTPVPVGSGLNQPTGVAVDAAGDVFIADTGNYRVVEVPAGGGSQIVLSSGYSHVSGVAVDASGNLYVTDSGASTVQLFPAGGGSPVPLGSGWNGPTGITVDGAGDVFVAETSGYAIVELPVGGGSPITLPFTGVNSPAGVAVDQVGNVYISDTGNHRILEMPASGSGQVTLVSGLGYPYLLTVTRNGELYIPDLSNGQVLIVNPHQPGALNFGALGSGGTGGPLTVTATNIGNQALTFPVPASGDNPAVSANFQYNSEVGSACPLLTSTASAAGTLAIGAPCNLSVNFVPTETGTITGSLILTDNTLNATNPYATQTVSLTGSYAGVATTTSVSSSLNPSTYGQAVTLTATVYSGPGTVNSGTVTFNVDGSPYSGASNLPLNGSGYAQAFLLDLPPGAHSITASYSGSPSAELAPSTSPTLTQTVNQIAQAITFTPPTSPVTYGVSPITLVATGGASGNPVTFSLVSGPGSLSGTNNSTLTVTGIGTIVVAANQAGNTNYSAASQVTQSIAVTVPAGAALSSPASGSTLPGTSATFTWPAANAASGYWLFIGTTGVGSKDLYDSGETTATSVTYSSFPITGVTIYVRLFTSYAGTLVHNDYVFTAANPATLTSPAPGATLPGTSATFTWSAATGTGVQGYWLFLGTTGVGSKNLYDSGEITATSATVSNLPLTGVTIYARVYTSYNGTLYSEDYTYTAAAQALLTSPVSGATLPGTSATFTWSAATGTGVQGYWLFLGTTGVGSKNLYDSGETTATSATVSNLPLTGVTIYARVYTSYNGTLYSEDYTYTAASQALLTSPVSGATLPGTSATFTWSAATGTGVQGYWLFLGTTGVGSKNLYDSGETTATSATVSNLPLTGATIYARVYTSYNGTLYSEDYTYTAASQALLTSPVSGATLPGTSATFTWSAATGTGVQGYWLFLGTTGVGSKNLYDSGETTATSATVSNLPLTGATIYARVYTSYNGTLYSEDYTYTAASQALLTSPVSGATLPGTSATFTWSAATGSGVQGYWLFLGTTGVGSKNLYDSGETTATSATVSNLPLTGVTIYARVYTSYNGTLYSEDYTYTAAAQAALTTPTPGTPLQGPSATFDWSAATGTGVQGYWLFLGTTGVGSKNLYDSGETTALTETVNNLPTSGTVYARIYTSYNGTLVYLDYTYTAQ